MQDNEKQKIIATLKKFITSHRIERMEQVLAYRTRYITVVLEDIYQPHNASAVLRSCDAFGIQDVHTISRNNSFTPNAEVSLGSSKWLTIHQHIDRETTQVYNTLRHRGYKIVATALDADATKLHDISVDTQPFALIFGSELAGLTKEAIQEADEIMYIPMFGFVESFNISVSVALALCHVVSKLHNSDAQWHLSHDDKNDVLLSWLRSDVHKAKEIETKTV